MISAHNQVKYHNGRAYSGMPVGRSHSWIYPRGEWTETKVKPDLWSIRFRSRKTRVAPSPTGSGAEDGSRYHWYILANQTVEKVDKDSYETMMTGLKYKVGHRRPYWKKWSYEYDGQVGKHDRIKQILEDQLSPPGVE